MFNFFRRFASTGRELTPRGLALQALARGRYAEAEQQLGALLDADPPAEDLPLLYNKRGVARMHLKRRDDAFADFCAALDLAASYAPALTNVGNLLLEDGALDDAIAYYQAAIRSDEDHAAAHQNLGVAYRRMGRIGDAVRELRKAQRIETRVFGPRRR
jgi:tetratricopeptide (TPR) repeat protein